MPFCRKCGRRLVEYSESCLQCGTSTTAPLIKINKARAAHSVKAFLPKGVAKEVVPFDSIISVKVIVPTKAKAMVPVKAVTKAKPITPLISNKPVIPATVYPKTEIIKSDVPLKEDIIAHPKDYETQPFEFDLQCPNGHFWPAGKALVVSNGKAYCLKCGERLRKPKRNRRQRYFRP